MRRVCQSVSILLALSMALQTGCDAVLTTTPPTTSPAPASSTMTATMTAGAPAEPAFAAATANIALATSAATPSATPAAPSLAVPPSTTPTISPATATEATVQLGASPSPVVGSVLQTTSLVVTPDELVRLYGVINGRLYRSEDGGQSWAAEDSAGLPAGVDIRKVAIDYQHPETLYLTTLQGIYRRDGQGEWRLVNALRASALAVDFRDPNVLWAGGWGPDPLVLKSTDGGHTWARADTDMVTLYNHSIVTDILVNPNNPDMLWAITLDSEIGPCALWRKAGNGEWERLNLGAFDPGLVVPEEAGDDTGYPAGIAYDPNANLLFVGCIAAAYNHGSVFVLRSPNADAPDASTIRWELAARFPPLSDPLWSEGTLRPLAVDAREPKSLFAALSVYHIKQAQQSNQLFVSHDAGTSWEEIDLSQAPTTPGH